MEWCGGGPAVCPFPGTSLHRIRAPSSAYCGFDEISVASFHIGWKWKQVFWICSKAILILFLYMSKYILSFFVRISQLSYGCTVLSVSFCRFEQGNTPKKTNVRPVLPVILSSSKDALLHKLVNMLFFHIFHTLEKAAAELCAYTCSTLPRPNGPL